MSDYIEITLDPPGVPPAWLEDEDPYGLFCDNRLELWPGRVSERGWGHITSITVSKDSAAYARYLASKKPEAPALERVREHLTMHACGTCGALTLVEHLDGKPPLLRRRKGWRGWALRRLQKWLLAHAANEGDDFDWLECGLCYGPGYTEGDATSS